jgi:guanylate kinase
MSEIKRRGLMLVLSSPSGAGKTTLSRKLLASDPNITLSVSATTRAMRPTEVEGKDYFFISPKEFDSWVKQDAFLEHAVVFENRYGTPKGPVEDALVSGRDVLFDIDWQGTQQMKERARDDLVSVFILPPSHAELERRLKTRAEDTDEVVAKRMEKAADEISHWPEYDYIIINDNVDRARTELEAILVAERLKRARQVGIPSFVGGLTHK